MTHTEIFDELYTRYPALAPLREAIDEAFSILYDTFIAGGKLLVGGNGGSAADSGHLAGELLKRFRIPRPIDSETRAELEETYGDEGKALADKLEGSLPVISLPDQTAIMTAIANDTGAEFAFAQMVYGFGGELDTLLCISTSGNSRNLVQAARVALTCGMSVIALVGERESVLDALADVTIHVPATETAFVQEYHLPIYHALAAALEVALFDEGESQ